jgi:hypothetical protein
MPQYQDLSIRQAEQEARLLGLGTNYTIEPEVVLVPASSTLKLPTWDGVRVFDPTSNALVEAAVAAGDVIVYSDRGVYDEAQSPAATTTVHQGDATVVNRSASALRLAFMRMTRLDYHVSNA